MVALAFGPLVNITTKSLRIIRVEDEVKELENSFFRKISARIKNILKRPLRISDKSENGDAVVIDDLSQTQSSEADQTEENKKDR